MRLLRVAAPALIGALLLWIAVQSTAASIGEDGDSAIRAYRTGLIPGAIGVALLLAALAISRRSRVGYLLGFAVAALMVLSGLALVALEIPFLGQGGISGALAVPVMVVAVVWCLLWIGYGLSFRRSRATFASAADQGDRRFAIVLAALAVFSTTAYVSLSVIDSNAAANDVVDQAQAALLVAGTSVTVEVVDVRVGTGAGASQPVEHLVLEVTIFSSTTYLLAAAPRLCLTDLATYQDPSYKEDVYCWGTPDPDGALLAAFADLTVSPDRRSIRLELDRGASLCPFGAGGWNAALTLAPQLGATPGGGVGPAPELFTITTVFEVSGASVSPPDVAGASCTALSVSP